MNEPFASLLGRVSAGENLSLQDACAAIEHLVAGQCPPGEIGLFLTALAAKGETAEEIAGTAQALRAHMTPIRSRHAKLLDTCGTGGGGSDLFNVSTAAALVIAATGAPVAKHGNRSVTSRSGSADVLAELGVNIEATVPQIERCLDELCVCFCFAPLMHPAMKHVSTVRRQLGIRTIFNIVGPLANPAGATHQLMGAGRPELRPFLAAALVRLNISRALVVSGADGLGEVTVADSTNVSAVDHDSITELEFTPEQFGITRHDLAAARIKNAAESAAVIRGILGGEPGPARDMVILNAAAGFIVLDAKLQPRAAAARAAEAIDSGAANDLLAKLAALSYA